MALRVSDTPPVLDSMQGEDLCSLARRALAAGEIAAYRALFAQVSIAEEHNARYQAFCRLICEGLSTCASVPTERLPAIFAAVAAGAMQVLESEPREPLLLNWAGVAMYELWALDGARALFGAAHRLDPELASLAGNLEALRRRQAQLGRRRAPSLLPEIPALVRHAKSLAASAHPASGMRISLCMIVRDEQEMLPRCLSAAAPVVDEIVIVDTGSTDTTIEIARSFGAKVIEREWTGSFAQARNASFQAATGDWLLHLDADEILVSDDAAALRALAGRTWREAFMLREINYTGSGNTASAVTNDALRMVRNRPQYRFQGALHEQIAWSLPTHLPERIESTEIRIEHFGYLDEVRETRKKTQRNVELLNAEASSEPEGPFLHYNLGCEQLAAGRHEQAILEFERAWQLIEQDPEHGQRRWVPTLAIRHVRSLGAAERHQQAADLSESALARFPDFTDLLFEQARALTALGRHQQALGLCERCIEMGDARTPYTATAGCGSHLPRMLIAELLLGESQAQRHAQAIASVSDVPAATEASAAQRADPIASVANQMELLARLIVAEHDAEAVLLARLDAQSGAAAVLAPLLEALLKIHELKSFERLLPLLEAASPAQRERRELLGGMYLRQGFLASAAQEWMAVCADSPDARAWIGLAKVAQCQQMPEQAIDFAQAALACDPQNDEARQLISMRG
jgi:tetratricopeptide (TPR) repeat protein